MSKFVYSIVVGLLCMMTVCAAKAEQKAAGPAVESKIGIEGTYFLRYDREGLIPVPANERSPIVLRIANVVRDKDSFLYEIHFIGTRAGEHDLHSYLAQRDGKPLTNLPPLKIMVHEVLPKDHDGAIEPLSMTGGFWAWPYRAFLRVGLILWGLTTCVLLVRRFLRQRPKKDEPKSAAPTLADQFLPLIEAALAGKLETNQKAHLEMLLLAHWRKKLGLVDLSPEKALRQMRNDNTAGKLLRELESWLHARPGTRKVDVAALLAPYRTAAAVNLAAPELEVSAR